jgi:hypothetical protein
MLSILKERWFDIAKTFKEHRNRFQGMDSASLCNLVGRYVKYKVVVPACQYSLAKIFKDSFIH